MEGFSPVYGDTYPVKDALKALGARWDAKEKLWTVPNEKLEEAKVLVRNVPPKNDGKRCWECGRNFTKSECARNGGDWSESYCGC